MALLFSDGLDGHISLAHRWNVVDAGASIVTDAGKYGVGTHAMKIIDYLDFNTKDITATSPLGDTGNPIHVSFFIKLAANTVADKYICTLLQSANVGTALTVSSSGAVSMIFWNMFGFSPADPKIITPAGDISDNAWHHVEFKFVEDGTSGIFKLWIDGVLTIDFSGDTTGSGSVTSGISSISFYGTGSSTDTFYDDILVWDETGSSMNTSGQLGLTRIETLIPNGAGNSTQLTPTGAGTTNAERVDEGPADDDTTYVASATTTHKDLYTYSNMAGTPATIKGVAVHSRISNPDVGPISMKPVARSNVTELSGTTVGVTAGGVYSQNTYFFPLDPNGSIAWTKSAVDAAQFGVEVV